MVTKYFNSIFLSVILCCILFYSGVISIPSEVYFNSIVPCEDIVLLKGKINSSPSKLSNGKYYSSFLNPYECESKSIKSECNGIVKIYIPSQLTEAFFPGKFFSVSDNQGNIFESGANVVLFGKFINNIFYVNKCIYNEFPNTLMGKISKFRGIIRIHFKRLMYSWGKAGGLFLALLSGAKEYTDSNLANAFKKSGLSHILALSGMHLSMFSNIAIFFGNKIGRKKLTFIIRIIALIFFVWFAGFSPSLLRAFICSFLMLFASICNVKNPDMLHILSFCFLLQIIISPSDLNNIGFILSYGALAGILITNKFFYRYYSKFLPVYISSSLAASTGAQIITTPISLKVFGSFAPIGIIATTIVSPFITIYIYIGLILIIFTLIFPVISVASGFLMNFQYNIIEYLVTLFSNFPMVRI